MGIMMALMLEYVDRLRELEGLYLCDGVRIMDRIGHGIRLHFREGLVGRLITFTLGGVLIFLLLFEFI